MLLSLLLVIETCAAAVFAVNSGGGSYTAADGTVFSADTDYTGGATYSTSAAISGTPNITLYQTVRWGNFSYNIPLANGNYYVTLEFSEIYFNSAGQRVFNVYMQGKEVISNLDIYAEVGANAAYDVTVPVSVTNGTLNINFSSTVNYANVSAIEITQGSPPPSTSSIYGLFYTTNGAIGVGQGFTVTQAGPCWDITFTSASLHHNVVWPACLVTPGYSDIASTGGPTSSAYCAWTYADYGHNGQYAGSYDGYICCRDASGIVQPPPQGPLSISFTCQW